MADDEERIREYEERVQLETLKRWIWKLAQTKNNSFCCCQESVYDEISGSGEEKAKTSVFSKYKWSHGKTAGERGLNKIKYLHLAIFIGDGDAPAIEDEVCIKDG